MTLVGARGFEPPTSRSQTERTTRLCYAPSSCISMMRPDILAISRSQGQGSQEIERPFQGNCAVTYLVLHFGRQLSKRLLIAVRDEHWIVAEPVSTPRGAGDSTVAQPNRDIEN